MAQDRNIGTPIPKFRGRDNNQALTKPSPADRDRNQAVPKTDMERAFPGGIRWPDKSPIGPMINDKEA